MLATKDYNIGDVITAEESFVHVLDSRSKGRYCDHCTEKNDGLKKCAKCNKVGYCDRRCQVADWKWHKFECQYYRERYGCLQETFPRLLLRIHHCLHKCPDLAEKEFVYENIKQSYKQLKGLEDNIRRDEHRMGVFHEICGMFNHCGVPFYLNLFTDFCKTGVNMDYLLDINFLPIGKAVFLLRSLVGHSCVPNAAQTFSNKHLEIRAMKPIKMGEEITIDFAKGANPQVRRQILNNQYYFECKCSRCESDFHEKFDYEKFKKLKEEVDICFTQTRDWKKAYECAKQLVELKEILHEGMHPDLTVQLIHTLEARCMLTKTIDAESNRLIERIKHLIRNTHGDDHALNEKFQRVVRTFSICPEFIPTLMRLKDLFRL